MRLAPLVLLVALSAGLAVLVHVVYFRHYSTDADEAAYLLQARNLAEGHLTLPAAAHGDFFRPWLTGEYHGRLFTKYLPGYPSVLAVSLALFGTAVPALGIIAGGWVVSTYAAGLQLLGSRRTALLAAGLVALSPIAIVQSALYLSYALSSALIFAGGGHPPDGVVDRTATLVRRGGRAVRRSAVDPDLRRVRGRLAARAVPWVAVPA
jgi:4-amino-4-deoxy-L-arabinose transferase-like glycosyltransferase